MSVSTKHNYQASANSAGSESSSLLEETVVSPPTATMMLRKKCWNGERKIQVDILAALFGISSWVAINGMFAQLPLLVQTAPEAWNLPSYLSLLIQAANIGPILYSLTQKYCPRLISDSKLIYLLLVIGSTSVMFMGLYYSHISVVFGEPHSMVLFITTFGIALLGCTSSVLFIPFMNNFPELYLISFFVGEGFSGFIPSLVSLVQGVGGNPQCVNMTTPTGEDIIVPYTPPPNFSSKMFFFILFSLMVTSTISFFLLNNLPSCKAQKIRKPKEESATNSTVTPVDTEAFPSNPPDELSPYMFKVLLGLTLITSMVSNGALPSAQSYSCLPYGNLAYHLAVNLGNIANPAACFLAYALPQAKPSTIISLFSGAGFTVAFVMTTAAMSPFPPLQHSSWGTFTIVTSWFVCHGLISYVKMSIAAVFRSKGGRSLFLYGSMTQIGATIGSAVMFYLINYQHIFTSYHPCS